MQYQTCKLELAEHDEFTIKVFKKAKPYLKRMGKIIEKYGFIDLEKAMEIRFDRTGWRNTPKIRMELVLRTVKLVQKPVVAVTVTDGDCKLGKVIITKKNFEKEFHDIILNAYKLFEKPALAFLRENQQAIAKGEDRSKREKEVERKIIRDFKLTGLKYNKVGLRSIKSSYSKKSTTLKITASYDHFDIIRVQNGLYRIEVDSYTEKELLLKIAGKLDRFEISHGTYGSNLTRLEKSSCTVKDIILITKLLKINKEWKYGYVEQ